MSQPPSPFGPWHVRAAVPAAAGSHPVTSLPGREKVPRPFEPRAYPRFQPRREMACRLRTVTGGATLPAVVLNISRSGVGLLTDQPLAPGTCVLAELASSSGLFARTLLLHLLHVSGGPAEGYALGGEFLGPLAPEELNLLLG